MTKAKCQTDSWNWIEARCGLFAEGKACKSRNCGVIACFVFLACGITASGQVEQLTPTPTQATAQPVSTTTAAAELQTFQQVQQSLAQSQLTLMAQGATWQQMQTWQQQNATVIAAQAQRALDISSAQGAVWMTQPISLITQVEIPEGASQEMSDFLTTRADLFNRAAQLHNAQVANADSVFQQQNSAEIATQAQRSQDLAAAAVLAPLPVPPPLVMPANASPQMQTFLTLRDQLARSQIALWNQNVTATATVREAAMEQWQQQNATQIQQMQAMAQAISSAFAPASTSTTTTNN